MQDELAPVADIGHVHLKVSDLERAIGFYRDLVGMTLKHRIEGAAFLGFRDYHHHLAVNVWRTEGCEPAPAETTGLYHFAIRYSTRRELAAVVKRLLGAGIRIDSTSDCAGAADSIYLRDPDENGLELTWDRPRESQPKPRPQEDGPLDLEELLNELG
jgi:catechol 2,3-dioxygenase